MADRSGVQAATRRIVLTGPHSAREWGTCGTCDSHAMVTMRGHIKSTARIYQAEIGFLRIGLCADCLAALDAEIRACMTPDNEGGD